MSPDLQRRATTELLRDLGVPLTRAFTMAWENYVPSAPSGRRRESSGGCPGSQNISIPVCPPPQAFLLIPFLSHEAVQALTFHSALGIFLQASQGHPISEFAHYAGSLPGHSILCPKEALSSQQM